MSIGRLRTGNEVEHVQVLLRPTAMSILSPLFLEHVQIRGQTSLITDTFRRWPSIDVRPAPVRGRFRLALVEDASQLARRAAALRRPASMRARSVSSGSA